MTEECQKKAELPQKAPHVRELFATSQFQHEVRPNFLFLIDVLYSLMLFLMIFLENLKYQEN